jgi:transcriptional regulator with XRE-family HTH domain
MIRDARKRRRWSRSQLGAKVGLGATRIGQIERGDGTGVSLEIWFALGQALDMSFRADFARDRIEEPEDAGHLGIQELALRLGRLTGRPRTFELSTRPANPSFSIDVGVRDDSVRVLFIEECWNTFGNINAAVRSTRRKIAEAEQLAVAIGGELGPYRVAAVWIVRDTRRNREIVSRYPEVFAAAFTGSSRQWVKALTTAAVEPPVGLGLVWCDLRATRLFAWRKPGG